MTVPCATALFPVGGAAGTMAGVVCQGGHAMINQ
jgi:hypothetical protein